MENILKYVRVRRAGDTLVIGIPKEIVRKLEISQGETLHIVLDSEDGFTVEKVRTEKAKS